MKRALNPSVLVISLTKNKAIKQGNHTKNLHTALATSWFTASLALPPWPGVTLCESAVCEQTRLKPYRKCSGIQTLLIASKLGQQKSLLQYAPVDPV